MAQPKGVPPRLLATRHEATANGIKVERVVLHEPPVAVVSELESVILGWWYRAGGYPVGRTFGTPFSGIR